MSVTLTHDVPERLSINALFIQPTSLCALNCKGCYVKDGFVHHRDDISLSNMFIGDLIRNVNKKQFAPALFLNQITFAVDVINSQQKEVDRGALVNRLATYRLGVMSRRGEKDTSPEFHTTFFSLNQIFAYGEQIAGDKDSFQKDPVSWAVNYLKWFDLISLSQITLGNVHVLKRLKRDGLKINWNYQPSLGKVGDQINLIKTILPAVQSMYFILHKPDLGQEIPKNITNQYFHVLSRLRKELEPELFAKIQVDGCVKDAKKFVDTGFGCSSNVSRFQVWPGGYVTGCPYKHSPSTGKSENYDELIHNIRKAKKHYEFTSCKIPQALHPEHPRFQAMKDEAEFPYLRILQ